MKTLKDLGPEFVKDFMFWFGELSLTSEDDDKYTYYDIVDALYIHIYKSWTVKQLGEFIMHYVYKMGIEKGEDNIRKSIKRTLNLA